MITSEYIFIYNFAFKSTLTFAKNRYSLFPSVMAVLILIILLVHYLLNAYGTWIQIT